jgi:tetratricopeptide (TPR) repeat protein
VARSIYEQLPDLLPESIRTKRSAEILTETQCADSLGFTDYDRYRIADEILNQNLSKPPFTAQAYHTEQIAEDTVRFEIMKKVKTPEKLDVCARQYRAAIEKHLTDPILFWKYGRFLAEETINYQSAAIQFEKVQSFLPLFHRAFTARGQVLAQMNHTDDAAVQFCRAISLEPYCADPHYHLARILHKQGRLEEAATEYSLTLRYRPGYQSVFNYYAEVLQKLDRFNEAIAVCLEGISYYPKDANLYGNLALLYDRAGRRNEAVDAIQKALQLNPDSAGIRRIADKLQINGS